MAAITDRIALQGPGTIRDYLTLTKPRAVVPHFVAAASGMFMAVNGLPPLATLFLTLAGGGLVAAASNTLNCYIDRELDKNMERTRNRPLPSGRLQPRHALIFGLAMGVAGLVILGRFTGPVSTVLAAAALAYYVVIYTLLLKRRTHWSIIVGSGVGGLTPVIGWAAVTSRITWAPFLLSAIIVIWTLPHFWSLALFRRTDYSRAGLDLLPPRKESLWIILSSGILVVVTILLAPAAGMGHVYLYTAVVLGIIFIYLAARVKAHARAKAAFSLYSYSIAYIALLFGAIIVDRLFS